MDGRDNHLAAAAAAASVEFRLRRERESENTFNNIPPFLRLFSPHPESRRFRIDARIWVTLCLKE